MPRVTDSRWPILFCDDANPPLPGSAIFARSPVKIIPNDLQEPEASM